MYQFVSYVIEHMSNSSIHSCEGSIVSEMLKLQTSCYLMSVSIINIKWRLFRADIC